MKVLVTGASGFLGSHVVEWLRTNGHTPRALVRPTSDVRHLTEAGVELAVGAVEQPATLPDAVRGVGAIVHAAGLVKARNRGEFERVNQQGTKNLLQAVREHNPGIRRFIYVGSQAAIGPSRDGTPIGEDAVPSPVTTYGRTKLGGERATIEYAAHFPVTALRPCALYGPRDREIFAVFQWCNRGIMPVLGDGNARASMLYGADAAGAVGAALTREHESGRTFFIDDGRFYTYNEIVDTIGRVTGRKVRVLHVPVFVLKIAGVVAEVYGKLTGRAVMLTREKVREMLEPNWICDGSRIRNELGWSHRTDFEQGAKETFRWYRANGWL